MTARGQGLALDRAPLAAGSEALLLAARSWPASEREMQLAAIAELVAGGQADELVLVAARRGAALVGAALAQVLAGRAAVVWPPQLAPGESPQTAAALLEELARQLAEADVMLAQALVEDPHGGPALALLAGGFEHAGDLAYMCAAAESFPTAPLADPLIAPLSLEPYSQANYHRLIEIVAATYRGSLDCPRIDGLRDTADVLDGYRAVGQSGHTLWVLATAGGKDVGCLLVADHPQQEQMEIVYLGIVPEFRGRGWGLALTRQAQWQARQAGRSRVVLAVDAANKPAIAAYNVAGFIAWDRRSVLVRSFRAAVNHAAARV